MRIRLSFYVILANCVLLNMELSADDASPDPQTAYRQTTPLVDLQQQFVDLRFGMFIHFNMATFQDREWGDPAGPIDAFNPTALDTDQWALAAKSAGMRFGCLTTKHHDGFCLWPTTSGGDGVAKTAHKTDIVRAYVDSFRKQGLGVGLYYSILDLRGDIRHFNVTPEKIARIKTELTELLTNYGDINILIFDGWDAPWSRITYGEVPFDEIYALVKRLQPNCLISELNASQYPPSALYYTDIKSFEQNAGQELPRDSELPALSCVTLTDGWFWKQGDENRPLKSAAQVVDEWLRPQNDRHCVQICNAAPNREGRLAPNIVARLKEIGERWTHEGPLPKLKPATVITTLNLATGRPIHANDSPDTRGPDLANDGDFGSSWYLPHGQREGWIAVDVPADASFNTLVFAEPIGRWQDYKTSRIQRYVIEASDGEAWRELASGDDIVPVRIVTIPRSSAARVRLRLWACSDTPHISEIGVYNEPRPVKARVDELVGAMTTEEKVRMLYGETGMSLHGVPRLGIPSLLLADGPVGIRWDNATAFPASIALASTWDRDLASRFGTAMAMEWRNKGRQMWLGPAFNIIRVPQNGRNFEYYSEDPYLAGRLAVSVIEAAQAQGVIACAKHFAANNQEHDRNTINNQVDERTLREIYLPAFEAAVKEAHVGSVMTAYNRLNGPYCTASEWLQTEVLKNEWGFDGFVVSDWGAAHDTVKAANAGLDLEMDTYTPVGACWGDGKLLNAVHDGKVSMARIDDMVRRILRGIVSTGMMDKPWDAPNVELIAHRALVREIAAEGAVLLKNENNVLPLDRSAPKTIALLGPNCMKARTGGGGSSEVTPTYSVSPVEGMRNVGGKNVIINAVAGVVSDDDLDAAPAEWLATPDGKHGGLQAEYFNNKSLGGSPTLSRVDGPIEFRWGQNSPASNVNRDEFSVRWTGRLTVPNSGRWEVGMATDDGCRMFINGEKVIDNWNDHGLQLKRVTQTLTAGKSVDIVLEYYEGGGDADAIFVCQQADFDAAVAAGKAADAAVICVGLGGPREGEGFDRPTIDLTPAEIDLIHAVAAVQPNTIVVVVAGSQVGFDAWMDEVPAIVQAWYGGQEAGNAMADVLFGDVNPSGRLPMTFVRKWEDHPAHATYPSGDYSEGLDVGYRYFDHAEVAPAFAFGHGLSYTTFAYSNLSIDTSSLAKDGTVVVGFDVKNTGEVVGKESPQVYVRDVESSLPRPFKELKGFDKVELAPGASTHVTVTLDRRSFAFYDVAKHDWRVEPGEFEVLVGASASDVRLKASFMHP